MNNKLYQTVESVLNDFPETRDNDILLCLHTLIRLGYAHKIPIAKVVIDLNEIDSLPAFETITRVRRVIQNEEKRYLPTEHTMEQRKTSQNRYIKEFGHSRERNRAYTFQNSHLM